MSLLHYHPFKGLYLAVELAFTLFVRVPVWVALSLPRSWRPRPSWSIKRVLRLKLFKTGIKVLDRTGPLMDTPSHLAITPGVDVNGVWVDPVPHLITSPLTEWSRAAGVNSLKIPGYWIHKQGVTIPVGAPPMPGEKVLYSMHGGAYTHLSAHPSNLVAAISKGILKRTDSIHRVFAIEYRLSSESFAPFPAALLDALAGYNYLVNQVGIHPADIVFEGDSAGANLAHALTRYLIEHQNDATVQLPAPPGSLLLLSPWVDLSSSHDRNPATDSSFRFADSDYLDGVFIGPHGYGAAETNRYISPAAKNPMIFDSDSREGTSLFNGFPRTFIVVGGAETLYDQIKTFIDRMVSDLGHGDGVKDDEGKVAWYEAPDAVHDFLIFAWHEPERTDALKAIAAWIDKA
ncbi:alpha/beta-hydrolase [Pleurotus eryngii]|uniref:Alpha/beta-hydrolase n=1 Tax=Pleurotus eryngii TaxID=5323 RepID=A0A9P6DJX2_PLEER|nr:alpha/beta-hydrolase [Pleurotus eryngii]